MNRVATAAKLSADPEPRRRAPALPERKDEDGKLREWHVRTRTWWRDIWRSPMAPEFLESDIHGLYLLAELVDRFWTEPSVQLAVEIRLQRQCFGLTPIDRRRLQWEVEKVEAVTRKAQPPVPVKREPADDPRQALRVLA